MHSEKHCFIDWYLCHRAIPSILVCMNNVLSCDHKWHHSDNDISQDNSSQRTQTDTLKQKRQQNSAAKNRMQMDK